MKIILTLLIMIGVFLGVCLYFFLFSLFLKEEEKYLTIPYGFIFFSLFLVLYMCFISIYDSL